MNNQEIQRHVVERVKPILDELGYEGFMLVGYVRDAEGHVNRSMVCDGKNNPMVQDAIQPMVAAGTAWMRVRTHE